MKVYECSPFYNENELLKLKVKEGSEWIDEFRISECDHTFKYSFKGFNLSCSSKQVRHLKLEGKDNFVESYIGLSRSFPFIKRKPGAWENEKIQRNYACRNLEPNDNDIVILSDIDEIIDSRFADFIVENVKRRGVITIKLHFSMFYMNLFSKNWHEVWPGSPKDYAYRVYIMTGKYFKNLSYTSDKLRHLGESGYFNHTIFCPDIFLGYHHSWLGDEEAIYNKLVSYAHDIGDHGKELELAFRDGKVKEFISKKVTKNQSIFHNHKLQKIEKTKAPWLKTIENNMDEYEKFFI